MNPGSNRPENLLREPTWQRIGAIIAAVVVLLIPAVLVPISVVFADLSLREVSEMPVWALEAFGEELLVAWFAALRLPMPILLIYGLVPLVVPPIVALVGFGTVGRWAALAGFCFIGSYLLGILGIGLLLELVAPGAPDAAIRLEVLAGLSWPLLALECCGCLLASAIAISSFEIRVVGDGLRTS